MSEIQRFKPVEIPQGGYFKSEKKPPPLSMPEVGFFGRALASFASTPQGKQDILDRFGIEGVLRDPLGPDVGDIADFAGDIPTTVLGSLGAAAGTQVGMPATGAALGGALGEVGSQSIGRLLGSTESPQFGNTAAEGVFGLIGGKIGGGTAAKTANPFRKAATTSNIRQNVIAPARKFGLEETLLPASRTESRFVGESEARIGAQASPIGEYFRNVTREDMRRGQQGALEGIAERVGVSTNQPRPGADVFQGAVEATREARLNQVGEMFDKAREALDSPETLPIVKDETLAALDRMAQRTQVSDLPSQNITRGARQMLESFRKDVESLQNFTQMDAFRRRVGDLLKSPKQMEELEKAGVDREFRDLYGGLARDLFNSLDEGTLARAFGQQGGAIRSEVQRGSLGIPINESGRDVGRRGASRMEATLGDEPAGELLDLTRQRIDTQKELRQAANEGMQDLMGDERSTILRMMRDPGQAENLYRRLFRRGGSVDNIRAFKRTIGAEETPGGLTVSPEGQRAWLQVQGQLMRDVREASEDAVANRLPNGTIPLDGGEMRKALDRLGGEDLLSEALGPDATRDLYQLADFIRESDPYSRSFSRIDPSAERPREFGAFILSLFKKGLETAFDKAAAYGGFPGQGAMSRYLTEGLAPGLRSQGIIRAIGTGVGTQVPRATSRMFTGEPE